MKTLKKIIALLLIFILYIVWIYFMGCLLFKQMVILQFDRYLPSFIEEHWWRFLLIMVSTTCISMYQIVAWETTSKGMRMYLMIASLTIGLILLIAFFFMVIYMLMHNGYKVSVLEIDILSKEIVFHKTHFIYWSFYLNLIVLMVSFPLFPPLLTWLWYEFLEKWPKLI